MVFDYFTQELILLIQIVSPRKFVSSHFYQYPIVCLVFLLRKLVLSSFMLLLRLKANLHWESLLEESA
jgi:hypothetical protein